MFDHEPTLKKKFEELLEMLTVYGKKSREEVLSLWRPIFDEWKEWLSLTDESTNLQEIENLLLQRQKSLEFEFDWILEVLKTMSQLKRAEAQLKGVKSKLSDLRLTKILHGTAVSTREVSGLEDALWSDKDLRKWISQSEELGQIWILVGNVEADAVMAHYKSLKRNLLFYRVRRKLRTLLRISFHVFWGLIVFTLLVNAIINMSPFNYMALLLTVGFWPLKEFVLDPWLSKKLLQKHRHDLEAAINGFYNAKFRAIASMMLFEEAYLEAATHDVTSSSETETH